MRMRRRAITLACTAAVAVVAAVLPQGTASAATTITDVPATLAYDAAWAVAAKITTAPSGKFTPATTVTNQQLATFLYRSANAGKNAPACTKAPFPDVKKTAAACGEISWLLKKKVITTSATAKFKPTAVSNRLTAATWLYRLAGASSSCNRKSYTDVPASSGACRVLTWMATQGLDNRATGGTFKPASALDRGNTATWLHRRSDLAKPALGADVSYPQCSSPDNTQAGALPSGQKFGVVGVNNRMPTVANPCLSDEVAWAKASAGGTAQPKLQLYVNTANPGGLSTPSWPTTGSSKKYGTCTGANTTACAYAYGQARAAEDVSYLAAAGISSPAGYHLWLDVETANTWDVSHGAAGQARNVAVLEGMADYLTAKKVAGVGLYATRAHWTEIVGTSVAKTSSLYKLPSWLAGSSTLGQARRACGAAALTGGGKVQLTQYTDTFDRDHSCV